MITTRRPVLRAGTIAAGAFAVVACTLAAPQPADAAVTRLGATPDLSFGIGTNYGTGCNHTLSARVDDPSAPVTFYDNGIPIARMRPGDAYGQIRWVPATQGRHVLAAVQDGQPAELPPATLDLSVGAGYPVGNGCAVFGG
ncbi:hypothetical protein [Nocardia sp. BMG51109]|uniref:hypothetical protein n=1 Tax=Nocardia sp. BMG51109 TaxID=1056816 RepID=UPI000463A757|nr:hypothetical protein [Nocardia sp. BMG51109]